jgi:hypothetical protein
MRWEGNTKLDLMEMAVRISAGLKWLTIMSRAGSVIGGVEPLTFITKKLKLKLFSLFNDPL